MEYNNDNNDYNAFGYYDVQWKMMSVALDYFDKHNLRHTQENINKFLKMFWDGIKDNDYEDIINTAADNVTFDKNSVSIEEVTLNNEYLILPIDNLKHIFENQRGKVTAIDTIYKTVAIELTTGSNKGAKHSSLSIGALKEVKEYEGFRVRDRVKVKGANEVYITF